MSLKYPDFVYSGLYIGKSNLAGGKRAGMQNGILYTGGLTGGSQEGLGRVFDISRTRMLC